jgi:hypothetical protein
MNQCKQCGATLPENAQYCLQCGTEVSQVQRSTPQGELDFFKPALTGGFALGLLSALPLINSLNIICCLWVQAGGGLGTWLLNKQRPGTLKYGDGAFVGVIAGLIGAFVATIINIPIQMLLFTPETYARLQDQLQRFPMSSAAKDAFLQFFTPGFNLSRTVIMLVLNIVMYGLFAMIGGILTVAIVNRKKLD